MVSFEEMNIKKRFQRGVVDKCPECGDSLDDFIDAFVDKIYLCDVNVGGKIVGKQKEPLNLILGYSINGYKCRRGHKWAVGIDRSLFKMELPCPNPRCGGKLSRSYRTLSCGYG